MTDVIVVGAGPTGLMLAGELALAGVEVAVAERRTTQDLVGTRARGFHARTIELLDQRGIADRFLDEGRTVQALSFAGVPLDVAGLPTRHPYTLGLGQADVERILLGWVEDLGVPIRRGVEVTGIAQDPDGVDVHLAGDATLRASYVIGADGGRSVVRRAAGIDVVGADATRSHLIAEVQVTEETPPGMRLDEVGIHALNPLDDGRTVGMVVTEQQLRTAADPTMAELGEALSTVYGTDFGIHEPAWVSRFTDATRQAVSYRNGRVLLAGDAAHTHPPTGGQGVGQGVQDAVNLGWKLAQVVRGTSPDALLDTYQAERHPATARVLENVMVQALLQRDDARTRALRRTFSDLLAFDGPRTALAALLTGLDVRLDVGEGHPLLGRRVPDLDLDTADGPRRMFELLHDARPVLLDLAGSDDLEVTGWSDRVRHVRAVCTDRWELPVVGVVAAPAAVLLRPDGHVGWVGEGTPSGLVEALTRWFGEPSSNEPA
jgi:3-(3-hydroxy-phenyl)propionate hydroxylase